MTNKKLHMIKAHPDHEHQDRWPWMILNHRSMQKTFQI